MDKKTGIILGVIAALVVVLVAVAFAMDSKTEKLGKDVIVVVEGNEYTTQEFNKYAKIINHAQGDINKKMTEEEINAMLDSFLLHKVYLDAAIKHNITVESGETSSFSGDYDKEAKTFASANISKEDFVQYKTDEAIAQKLQMNFEDYYSLPKETYDAVVEAYKEQDLYKSYSFRLMTIPYEAPTSGDESGDTVDVLENEAGSGDVSGDKEDKSRDAKLKVAEEVLAKIKSGDSFEELAKEHGSMRFTFVGSEYTLLNGELEYAVSDVLKSKLGNDDLYNAALEMNSGDVSEIIEDEEYTSFNILKIESIEEGFVGEAEKEFKSILLNQEAQNLVMQNVHYELNPAAYMRALYK